MALLSDYVSGTISIDANGSVVTGAGTAWLTAGFQEGDVLYANGFSGIVLSVNSNTSITIAQPWRGGALNASPYRLRFQGDGSRVSAQARQLVEALGAGNIQAIAGLGSAADTVPYFTGAGTADVADFTNLKALSELQGGADKLPYFSGAGDMALADLKGFGKAVAAMASGSPGTFLRAAASAPYGPVLHPIVGFVNQTGGVPVGAIVERGTNANGEYTRFADGTQICFRMLSTPIAVNIALGSWYYGNIGWTFPAAFTHQWYGFSTAARISGQLIVGIQGDTGPNAADSFFASPISIPSNLATIRQMAIGRWFS